MPEVDTELPTGEPTLPHVPMFTGGMVLPRDLIEDLDDGGDETPSDPLPVHIPASSVVVPSDYQYVKRWMFVLVVAAVWVFAAAAGWGLYSWWYQSIDKTAPVFVVLLFVILCTLGGLLIAMVLNRPVVSALAVALMSAPLAATAGAAVSSTCTRRRCLTVQSTPCSASSARRTSRLARA